MPQQKPWEKYAQPAAPFVPVTIGNADPTAPYAGPKAEADLARARADAAKAARESDPVRVKAETEKAVADAAKAKAEAAKATAANAKTTATPANLLANDDVLTAIARARQHLTPDSKAAGGYAWLSGVPIVGSSTEAMQLKGLLDTIRANVTFDRLQQMRNESPTGGAVGSASDADMKLLGNTAGNLDQNQGADAIKATLDNIERRYVGLRADMLGVDRTKFTTDFYAAREGKKNETPAAAINPGNAAPPSGGSGPTTGFDPRNYGGAAEGYAAPEAQALNAYKDVPNPEKEKAYWSAVQFLNTNPSAAKVREFFNARPVYAPGIAEQVLKYKAATGRYAISPGFTKDRVALTPAEIDRQYSESRPDTVFNKNLTNDLFAGLPRAVATSSLLDPSGARGAAINAADATHPNYATAGKIAGTAAGALTAEMGALRAARAFGAGAEGAARWAPRIGDFAYGGASGATANPNNPGLGALEGATLGSIGGAVGRGVGNAAVRAYRPSVADTEIGNAINNAGPDLVGDTLREAQAFNLPMTLADTAPQVGSIAGAAVRRSPNAAMTARAALQPRALGQIDRLGNAIERDLGPIGNVPQISADLQRSANTNARPLYDAAYPQTVNDPAISNLVGNPQLGDALNSARMFRDQDVTMARAQGQPEPPPLSIPQGPPQANGAVPSGPIDIRTIDYMKRGMDGRINTAFTGGDPQAAMSGPFLRDARRLMLARADEAVPEYGAARAAYAGPMRAQEALDLGQNAARPSVTANQLGVDLAGVEPGNIPQAQLGYRSGMMDKANSVRFSANPFDTALGTPEAVAKLQTMYPGNIGNARLLRQRDLERQMATTNNEILGGSPTAIRRIADDTFSSPDTLGTMAGVGADALSGAPINTAMNVGRAGMRRLFGARNEARAVAKADQMAPILLNPNADESLTELARILGGMQRYNRAVGVARPVGSIAGVGTGLSLPGIYGQ